MEEERADALEMAAQENMNKSITQERLDKYFFITKEALDKARSNISKEKRLVEFKPIAEEFLDMAQRYFDDANHFLKNGDAVTAFAALNYAHGWLDAGARMKLFNVKDSRLFASD